MPFISVLLPVYNAAPYLREALDSVLAQTFWDFECLVFDDGSTDASLAILESYNDPRLRIIHDSQNKGYVHRLNEGLDLATGKYVARMDADDRCHPQRFEKQVAFLEQHPDVVLCGTRYRHIHKVLLRGDLPCDDEAIRLALLYNNVFAHPTVMIRKQVLDYHQLRYPLVPVIEDYGLWIQLAQVGQLANLPEYLLDYRDGVGVSSKQFPPELLEANNRLKRDYAHYVFGSTVLELHEIDQLSVFLNQPTLANLQEAETFKQLVMKVLPTFTGSTISHASMSLFLRQRFFYSCTMSTHLGFALFWLYLTSGLLQATPVLLGKLAVKSFFGYMKKPTTS